MDNKNLRKPFYQILLTAFVFGAVSFLAKMLLFPAPQYNPPAVYAFLSAFLVASILWYAVISLVEKISVLWGFTTGLAIGFLTPLVMWFLFGVITSLEPESRDALGWSIIYAYIAIKGLAWITALCGGMIGAVLAWLLKRISSNRYRSTDIGAA